VLLFVNAWEKINQLVSIRCKQSMDGSFNRLFYRPHFHGYDVK
jgi:hypothetical protein